MLFNSQLFILGFLPCVLALYYAAAASRRLRQLVLVGASLVFYGYWDIRFVPFLAGLTLANWLVVRAFGRWRHRALLTAGVVMNLAVLAVCKYANFAAASWDALLGATHQPWAIVLPLGISFFTFQKISYLVDLRRGDRHVYGLLEFAAFVTFFPQLIAGPLVRHNEIIPQFAAAPRRPEMWENLARGAVLFSIGLLKKAALADTLALVVDPLFAQAAQAPLTWQAAWVAAGCYMLQIYYDFSGYSDMAIGLGLMFGLHLPFNFAAPYRATSIRDFWRRWHITLSRFLRDYVYVPLRRQPPGGRRCRRRTWWRRCCSAGCGMARPGPSSPGAGCMGWAWRRTARWVRAGRRMPAPLGWALTLGFVLVGWVLFRAPDFAVAASLLGSMAGGAWRRHAACGQCRDRGPGRGGRAAAANQPGPGAQAPARLALAGGADRGRRWWCCCCWWAGGCRMSSSISSSDPGPGGWRRFLAWWLGTALLGLAITYGFVALVDPWGMLPLGLPAARIPISTNARFSFPALARSPDFDSAILGTSTSRMLRPAWLDPAFGARFVNLAMNSATAWEQLHMLALFVRHHPAPHTVLIGLDAAWCTRDPPDGPARPFPGWMYAGSRWRGYAEIANFYAVQEAANQFAYLVGLKRRRYGLDGYTSFLPDDSRYDPARVATIFAQWGDATGNPPLPVALPALPGLAAALTALPPGTRKILAFMPSEIRQHGPAGSDLDTMLAACKAAITGIARRIPGSLVVDFQFPSPITLQQDNYWDPLHYRIGIADRIMRDLAAAAAGQAGPDDRILWPDP